MLVPQLKLRVALVVGGQVLLARRRHRVQAELRAPPLNKEKLGQVLKKIQILVSNENREICCIFPKEIYREQIH